MAAHAVLILDLDSTSDTALERTLAKNRSRRNALQRFVGLTRALLSGTRKGTMSLLVDGSATAKASQTISCDQSSATDGTDDITIGQVTLSVVASASTENQFEQGASDADFASNLAAAINDHSVLGLLFTAESDGVDEVTVTANLPGAWAHQIGLAESGSGMTLGGDFFASGAGLTGDLSFDEAGFGG